VTSTFFIGYIDELRVYYEVFPFAFLLVLPRAVDALARR
jgi:hypothetical protein